MVVIYSVIRSETIKSKQRKSALAGSVVPNVLALCRRTGDKSTNV
jgi:hypothetical protein